ncbi:MAG: hypothetical protein ACLFN8_03575 [Candidatus Woesearchaeota archaeon]
MIEKKQEREKTKKKLTNKKTKLKEKTKKIKTIIALSTLILIIAIVLLIQIPKQEQIIEGNTYEVYNGFEFRPISQADNIWETTVKIGTTDQRLEFRYHPLDLEKYTYNDEINQYFFITQMQQGKIIISYSDEINQIQSGHLSMAGYDLARILRSFLGYTVQVSIENNDEYTWFDCEDANPKNLVIKLMKGDPRIEANDFCIQIYFEEPQEAVQLVSLLNYNLLGVME